MATYDDALFRKQFPEFADEYTYPASAIQVYFEMAGMFISNPTCQWSMLTGERLPTVMNYMTAHLMTLSNQAKASSGAGGSVAQGGFEVSASIGEISVSRLAPPATGAWDWWLYQTPYGTALMALLSVLAVGGLSVGGNEEASSFRRAGGVFF